MSKVINKGAVPERHVRLLVGATGSVDIIHLPEYLRHIKTRMSCEISVLMTQTATQFLSPDVVALCADRVIAGERTADWPSDKPSRLVADHDVLVVLPATAHTLASIAGGAAPNRLTTVVLAATFPVILFPVMGAAMWKKAAVMRNVQQIKTDGYVVAEPVWRQNFDFSLGQNVEHPSLPTPEDVALLIMKCAAVTA
ncbi:flavoprotein [Xaviernesmea oryzae]|uniref:Flavoprotein n=1 Tax=Xaviernesmea oryzae TaxID=464029 RepID=A0A1Q9AU92_9HYPH|nr:flavoprotein [Xaviernesmea oryzae]OLP58914.1 flavoprotein [Xaviernesmea oryzae]SEM02040.1 Flavoprotein [Xaviernesmea oryzae]